MPITYNDLSNSDNKMAVLLYRLSYPEKNSIEYWDRWARKPLHELIFTVIRGLSERRQRIIQIQHEQDFIRQQYEELAEAPLVEEDREKIQLFLQQEYRSLIKMEQKIIEQQLTFLQEQENEVKKRLDDIGDNNQKRWDQFYKEQMKFIGSEMKKKGLAKEWQAILKEVKNDE